MKYYVEDSIHIIEVPVSNFKIIMKDDKKKNAYEKNYVNAGFFANFSEQGEKFTLPVGNIVCDFDASNQWTKFYCIQRGKFKDNKFLFESSSWKYMNQFYGKSVSTLIIKDGIAMIEDLDHLSDCEYAIVGVPIMRHGNDVKFRNYVTSQGWDGSTLYATWHIFIGLKNDNSTIYIMGMKTTSSNMILSAEAYCKFKELNFIDVIKLDGGGSFYMNVNGKVVASTAENRRVNTVITFDNIPKEEQIDMTEKQLRNKIVSIMKDWLGCKESDGSFKKIIDLYNEHKPLARGYSVKYTDEWCATTVSAAFIKAGLTDIGPTECSCSKMIELHKKLGQWEERDDYIPKPGDILMYDWEDNGSRDNVGIPNHVGIVENVVGRVITIIEGNKGSEVSRRMIGINGKYIRGYCLPNYKSKLINSNSGGEQTVDLKILELKQGNNNNSVRSLQVLLNGYGYDCGNVDGSFGPATLAAVKHFQKNKGLSVDGCVGFNTWNKLLGIN